MSLPATWRQFNLFDFLPIRDPRLGSTTPLYSDLSLSAITACQAYIVYAVQNSTISLLTKLLLELVTSFSAYLSDYKITFAKPIPNSNLVLTLAEKQGLPAVMKLWDLNKMANLPENKDTPYKFVTMAHVNEGDNSYPVSCFSFNDQLNCVALGYTNGKVILVRGDFLRDRGSKQRLVYESVDPITAVHFNRFEELLYVTTISKILTVLTTGRNQGKPHRILSNSSGVDLDCLDLEHKSSRLLTADREGLKFFNHVLRAQSVGFSIPKRKILRLFKDYVLIVCPLEEQALSTLTKLLVLDLRNSHVSFSLTVPNLSIMHAFTCNADKDVYLLSLDGVLYKLHEKPINQQLEIILQRELYGVALNLAQQNGLDKPVLLRILRQHGNYLYQKKDFDGAMEKYIECLPLFDRGPVPELLKDETVDDFVTSVVTEFKEVSHTQNMAQFLQRLHQLELADADHVTLLFSCFCKLSMVEELDKFIEQLPLLDELPKTGKLDYSQVNYLLFVRLLRECGYFAQATSLLLKLNQPHTVVEIQLDLGNYTECLHYIRTLPIDDLLRILISFLDALLAAKPMEMTELLINVFTGQYKPTEEVLEREKPQEPVSSYSAFLSYLSGPQEQPTEEPTYLPPRPKLVFHCFLYHEREFVVFLEACLSCFDKYQGNIENKRDLLITLFEMYLTMAEKEEKEPWLEKARHLLTQNATLMDSNKVLMVLNIFGFNDGSRIINENSKNFEENSFQLARASGQVEQCMAVVEKYGQQKPVLYQHMLRFIAECGDQVEKIPKKEIHNLLAEIQKLRLFAPIEVVRILSKNEYVQIGMLRDFLVDFFEETEREMSNNDKLIQLYESEATKTNAALTELTENPMVLRNAECSSCELALEFPVVHFRCKHSYHEKCLEENIYIPGEEEKLEPKCPLCVEKPKEIPKIDQNVFFEQLEEAPDRFKLMAEYVGKGALD